MSLSEIRRAALAATAAAAVLAAGSIARAEIMDYKFRTSRSGH